MARSLSGSRLACFAAESLAVGQPDKGLGSRELLKGEGLESITRTHTSLDHIKSGFGQLANKFT